MVFWSIVLGVIAVVLLLGWRHDRRRKGQLADVVRRTGVPRRYVTGAELYQELGAGRNGEPLADDDGETARDTDAPR